jgi:hypothetical protein
MIYFDEDEFVQHIEAYIQRTKHSVQEVADITGLDRQTIRRMLSGYRTQIRGGLGINTVGRLADYADLDINKYMKERVWVKEPFKSKRAVLQRKEESSDSSNDWAS